MPIPIATLIGFALLLVRTSALCMNAPLLGVRSVPGRVRLGLSLIIALVVFTAAGMPPFLNWNNTDALLVAVISETIIGLAAGLSSRFFVDAAAAAGHVMGLGMGLGFANVIDPLHGQESTALTELLAMLALGVAVAAGVHREAIAWLCRSAIEMPPGSAQNLAAISGTVVAEGVRAIALSVRLAYPALIAITFGNVALGLLSRTVPTLTSLNLGFAVGIVAGGGALFLVAPGIAEIAAHEARAIFVGR